MKDAKRTKVPVSGAKPKSKSKNVFSKASGALSQEFIGSDESAGEGAPQPKPAEKPKTTIGIHRPDGAATTKEKPSKTASATRKSATNPNLPPPKKATPKQITQENVGELSSPELSDDNEARPTREIQTRPAGSEKATTATHRSDSDSSSDNSSSESDVVEAHKTPKLAPAYVKNGAQRSSWELTCDSPARTSQPETHAVDFRPAQDYVPPKGFAPVPLNDRTISRAAHLFDNLDGKQLWHITVPTGVSLRNLQDMSMDKVMHGEAILSHKGRNYGLSKTESSEEGAREVLIPHKNGYKAREATAALLVYSSLTSFQSLYTRHRHSIYRNMYICLNSPRCKRIRIRAPRLQHP